MEFQWYKKVGLYLFFDISVNRFKLGFDAEIELRFFVGYSEGFKYDRMGRFSLGGL